MATENANRAESKLEKITSDLFDENKELKKQIEEATSKAESLQNKLLESKETNILLQEKLDAFDVANKRFKEILDKKDTRIKNHRHWETGQAITSNENWNCYQTSWSNPVNSSSRWKAIWEVREVSTCLINPCWPLGLATVQEIFYLQC